MYILKFILFIGTMMFPVAFLLEEYFGKGKGAFSEYFFDGKQPETDAQKKQVQLFNKLRLLSIACILIYLISYLAQ